MFLNQADDLLAFSEDYEEERILMTILDSAGDELRVSTKQDAIRIIQELEKKFQLGHKRLALVFVDGGLVQEIKAPASVIVKVWDQDNMKEGNECPNCFYIPSEDENNDDEESIEGYSYLSDLDNCPKCGIPFTVSTPELYDWLILNGVLDPEKDEQDATL